MDDGDLQDINRGKLYQRELNIVLSAFFCLRAVSNFSVSDLEPKGHETTHDALVR